MKVCFAASSGGHLEQLLALRPIFSKFDSFIVTERTSYKTDVGLRLYELRQVNRREALFVPRMIVNTIVSLRVFIRERPDAVVCTGVLACVPLCIISKVFGKKLVYIESYAKVNSATQTGRLLYRFADRFYVQWESMLDIYPDAIFVGGIY